VRRAGAGKTVKVFSEKKSVLGFQLLDFLCLQRHTGSHFLLLKYLPIEAQYQLKLNLK